MPNEAAKEKEIRELFTLSVGLKGFFAALELIAGIAALFVSPSALSHFLIALTQNELSEDPHDLIATQLLQWGHSISLGAELFGALYLISHAVVKLFLVGGLLKNKLWAYPASLGVLGVFVAYQLYRLTLGYSFGLAALTVFDLIVVWLIWQEYRIVERHPREGRAA